MFNSKFRILLTTLFAGVMLLLTSSTVSANHSWGGYHWARTANPFTLKLGNNLTSNWNPFIVTTSNDWSASSALHTTIVPGGTTARRCKPTSGQDEVCNDKYGNNGWLGIAQIWLSGGHIIQGVTKMNDSYFTNSKYNTAAWKNMVMCQEVGHTFGLDHQDEVFDNQNLGTCMDYTNYPESNQHPNSHDYEELELIYTHLDSFTSVKSSAQKLPMGLSIAESLTTGDFENRSDWGTELRNNGHIAEYSRDLGFGMKLATFVILAD